MRRTILPIVIAACALSCAFAGSARAYVVGRHANHEQYRINRGVRSGALTPHEAGRLQGRENDIRASAQADRAANGGTLTPGEKVRLGARQAALSGSIYADKHNAAVAPPH